MSVRAKWGFCSCRGLIKLYRSFGQASSTGGYVRYLIPQPHLVYRWGSAVSYGEFCLNRSLLIYNRLCGIQWTLGEKLVDCSCQAGWELVKGGQSSGMRPMPEAVWKVISVAAAETKYCMGPFLFLSYSPAATWLPLLLKCLYIL